ncbi:MAG TPA: hypothetical protein VFR27_17170 [Mycobacterium sp.]|nr:hypothetical protein [Mycobacterium sp.]
MPLTRDIATLPSSHPTHATPPPDNRLSFMDQAYFSTTRATGRDGFVQCLWVYDHGINLGGLNRFRRNLGRGLLGRRIERSPLPFGRHRWIAYQGPEIDIADDARPRADFSDWADERTQLPVDPEHGPCWHLGVLPFTDGSTAVSLVVSHCLLDGLGIGAAITDAVHGTTHDLGYPPPQSRPRLHAVLQDARETARAVPEVGRALAKAARQARDRRRNPGQAKAAPPQPVAGSGGDGGEQVVVPIITVQVDLDAWDARAKALGGMSHHLVVGFAAKLGERLGRRRPSDGLVTLQLPISERAENDTRALALSFVSINVDPTPVTHDLGGIRVANARAFKTQRQAPEAQVGDLAPLAMFLPKRALKQVVDAAFDYGNLPVGCSNGGDVDPALGRPDGTDASYAAVRGGEQQVTRAYLEQTRGQLTVWTARLGGSVCITVAAYQPGATNSKPALRELAAQTLAEFDLTGVID